MYEARIDWEKTFNGLENISNSSHLPVLSVHLFLGLSLSAILTSKYLAIVISSMKAKTKQTV